MKTVEIVKVVATGIGQVADGTGYAYVNNTKGHKASKIRTSRSLAEKLKAKGLGKILDDEDDGDDDAAAEARADRGTEKAADAATRRLAEGAKAVRAPAKKAGAKGKAPAAKKGAAAKAAKLEDAATGADTRDTTASQNPPLETNATDQLAGEEGQAGAEDAPPAE